MAEIHHQDHSKEMSKSWSRTLFTWVAVIGFIVVCASILMWKRNERQNEVNAAASATRTPEPVLTIRAAKAKYSVLPEVVVASGSVTARDPLEISAEVSGLKVEQVLVEEGDYVLAGQTLAVLNRSVLEAQLSQAQARLRSAQAQVGKAIQPNRSQDIERLRAAYSQSKAAVTQEYANLQQAEALLKNAEETSKRYQQVLGEGYVSAQEAADRSSTVAQNQAGVSAARQRYSASQYAAEQARQQLELALAGGRSEDIEIARASTQETAGVIAQYHAQIDQTVIKAPDAGWVLTRNVHLGEISANTKVMFTLARRNQIELKAEVPQSELLKLRAEMLADVRYAQLKTTGRIWQVSPAVNEQTRLGFARILLDPSSKLKPGMFAEARIQSGNHRALTIPAKAQQGEGGDYFVFLLKGDIVERQRIETGIRTNEMVEVVKGLKAGDEVVLEGASQLNDGDRVKVVP